MVAVVSVLGGGCSVGSVGDQADDWPPNVPEVEVVMREGGFEFPTPVPAGRVVFRVQNAGTVPHRVTLVPLPADLPPIEEQVHSDERRGVYPMGAINPRAPGEGSAFAVDLDEGRRYALICYEEDDDGVVHARQGEAAEFRAGGPGTDPPDDEPSN